MPKYFYANEPCDRQNKDCFIFMAYPWSERKQYIKFFTGNKKKRVILKT